MMGVPTAPNHMIRAQCHEAVFKRHPGIKLVAKGVDEDEIETAQSQATSIMKMHPNLKGWVSCDAVGPIASVWPLNKPVKSVKCYLLDWMTYLR